MKKKAYKKVAYFLDDGNDTKENLVDFKMIIIIAVAKVCEFVKFPNKKKD